MGNSFRDRHSICDANTKSCLYRTEKTLFHCNLVEKERRKNTVSSHISCTKNRTLLKVSTQSTITGRQSPCEYLALLPACLRGEYSAPALNYVVTQASGTCWRTAGPIKTGPSRTTFNFGYIRPKTRNHSRKKKICWMYTAPSFVKRHVNATLLQLKSYCIVHIYVPPVTAYSADALFWLLLFPIVMALHPWWRLLQLRKPVPHE